MKLGVLMAVLLLWSTLVLGGPHVAFQDLPEAVLLGDPGRVSMFLRLASGDWSGQITGSLSSRLDLAATVHAANLFDPKIRLLLVRDLLPLNVLIEGSLHRVSWVATLFLGPVHFNLGRTWGETKTRWGYVQYAFHQSMTLILGLDKQGGVLRPILGLRVHPGRTRLWGASLVVTRGGLRIAVGGAP